MKNIIITGVGGQGTILASTLIQDAFLKKGNYIKSTETIGMAQMGGSVNSHIRIGEGVHSPFVPKGQCDLLLAFEPAEGARNIAYLSKDSFVIASKSPIKPVTDGLAKEDYQVEDSLEFLDKNARLYATDFKELFDELGTKKPLNVAMIGLAIGLGILDIEKELREAMEERMPEKILGLNLKALEYGIEKARRNDGK